MKYFFNGNLIENQGIRELISDKKTLASSGRVSNASHKIYEEFPSGPYFEVSFVKLFFLSSNFIVQYMHENLKIFRNFCSSSLYKLLETGEKINVSNLLILPQNRRRQFKTFSNISSDAIHNTKQI